MKAKPQLKPSAPRKKSRKREDSLEIDYGRHVERTLRVLETLSKGPLTTEEVGVEFRMSSRTTTRFMAALERAGVPVYMRRKPGAASGQWTLDVEKFLHRFKTSNGSGA